MAIVAGIEQFNTVIVPAPEKIALLNDNIAQGMSKVMDSSSPIVYCCFIWCFFTMFNKYITKNDTNKETNHI